MLDIDEGPIPRFDMTYLCPILFLLSAGFVLYVIFGYPLLLELLSRRYSRPVNRKVEFQTVTVLLTVYNGEQWIRDKLRSILSLHYPREQMQILVISDGSTDRTEEYVREFGGDGVELLRVPRGGKANALNSGITAARGDVLFFTDVRQPLDPDCLASLVSCLGDPTVGAACGHVYFIGKDQGAHMGMYWRYEKWIRANHSRLDSILAGTGCIYAMRRELAVPIPPETLLDDSYLPLAAFLRGYRFIFDTGAIAYEYPTSLRTEFWRKVRTLAGIYQLVGLFPELMRPGSRMWLHFISYKLARLLLPFALLIAAGSSFGLPAPWSVLAVAGQAAFYSLALLHRWVPEGARTRRFTSVAHTFVVLMAASFCATSIFFVPARNLWKETRIATGRAV